MPVSQIEPEQVSANLPLWSRRFKAALERREDGMRIYSKT